MTTAHWRQRNAVLVTEAHSMGGIAAIRSLGRAGYPVYACASERNALGLASRYATGALLAPEYHDSQFIPWLRDVIAHNNIKAIVPSEGLLLAIRSKLAEFAHLIPVSQRDDVLYRGLSKADLFVELTMPGNDAAHAANLPPSIVVEDAAHVPDAGKLEALGAPLYIKVDACYGDGEASGTVYRATTAAAARERLSQALSHFRKALVQGHVPGQGVGAFFLVWDGKVVAEFMHRRIHEVPHTGGASSFRESWWHQGIRDDALAKLTCLRWSGVAMMEYRWDPATDRFYFIEMNGRFWGSLHLALCAGVDFPMLLMDSFFGHPVTPVLNFPLGVRCRYTFPRDVQYVWSRLKDRHLSIAARGWSVFEFLLLSLDPRVKSDLFFAGDSGLYWKRLWRFVTTLG